MGIETYDIQAPLAQKLFGYNFNTLRKISITNCTCTIGAHATLASLIGQQKLIAYITLVKLSIGSNLTYYSNALKDLKHLIRVGISLTRVQRQQHCIPAGV